MELEKACEHVFQVVEKFVMQTFLPYPDFAQSLRVLDSRRLGKQRLEAMQLLRAISGWFGLEPPSRRGHVARIYERAEAIS